MAVKRIICNIKAFDLAKAEIFYGDFLGMDLVMDHGWIKTFVSQEIMNPQISIASEGGNATGVPDISIEVDNVEALYAKAIDLNLDILYPLSNEEWGVRRFYVKDPFEKVVNILQHV
ncbi:MAG: glyoxalase superfamily protein [Acinetobacter sp.]